MVSELKLLLILLMMFNAGLIYSQEIPDLKTDRPDKTESASTVPAGWLQIETGFEFLKEKYEDNTELSSYNVGSTLFRYGIFEDLELRFAGGFLSENLKSSESESNNDGIAGLMTGLKYEFINDHQSIPDIALLLHAFLPFGSESHKPGKVDPQAVISAAYPITDFMDLGTNLGLYYNTSDEKSIYFFTLAAGLGITDDLGSFIELFSEIFEDTFPFYSLNAGFTYLLLSNLQLDVSGGNALFNNSKVWYLGTGISLRIPR